MEENTSGQVKSAVVPKEIRGWNWGAFLGNGIWAIGNQVWIGLPALFFQFWGAMWVLSTLPLLLEPEGQYSAYSRHLSQNVVLLKNFLENAVLFGGVISLAFIITLGVKGSEFAWRYRKWGSVEDFKKTQAMWKRRGIVLAIVLSVVNIILLFLAVLIETFGTSIL
jgi:hypothetical protein